VLFVRQTSESDLRIAVMGRNVSVSKKQLFPETGRNRNKINFVSRVSMFIFFFIVREDFVEFLLL
jgi:hypothetical protein